MVSSRKRQRKGICFFIIRESADVDELLELEKLNDANGVNVKWGRGGTQL
jgi:hypothetical protein